MKHFTVYLPATGQILRSGYCGDEDFDFQAAPGEMIIEGRADPAADFVLDGQVISRGDAPSRFHVWNWDAHAWQEDLAAALAQLKADIDAERERRGNLPIAYLGLVIDADATAQRNVSFWQAQLAAGVELPEGFVWRDANNVDHAADAAWVNGLGAAMALRGTRLYQSAWRLKAQAVLLVTVAEVMAFDIQGGWTE